MLLADPESINVDQTQRFSQKLKEMVSYLMLPLAG
jgi:hypothetical protein